MEIHDVRGPDFIIIGAPKSGTTSICHYLNQHPDIFLIVDTKFFTKANGNYCEYLKNFKQNKKAKITGEADRSYLYYGPDVPKRIKSYLPYIKLIAILRNPIDRAYSYYCMDLRDGRETKDFKNALGGKRRTRYLNQGFYYKHLMQYLKFFDRSQIKIYLYEDLCSDPVGTIQDMFRYIGVDSSFISGVSKKMNVGVVPKVKLFHMLLQRDNVIRRFVRNILKTFMPVEIRQSIRLKLVRFNLKKKTILDSKLKAELTEFYKEDITKLQALIKRDLSSWFRH